MVMHRHVSQFLILALLIMVISHKDSEHKTSRDCIKSLMWPINAKWSETSPRSLSTNSNACDQRQNAPHLATCPGKTANRHAMIIRDGNLPQQKRQSPAQHSFPIPLPVYPALQSVKLSSVEAKKLPHTCNDKNKRLRKIRLTLKSLSLGL